MLVLEGCGERVRGAVVSLEELMAHACGHLNCNVMLGGVRQMYKVKPRTTHLRAFSSLLPCYSWRDSSKAPKGPARISLVLRGNI